MASAQGKETPRPQAKLQRRLEAAGLAEAVFPGGCSLPTSDQEPACLFLCGSSSLLCPSGNVEPSAIMYFKGGLALLSFLLAPSTSRKGLHPEKHLVPLCPSPHQQVRSVLWGLVRASGSWSKGPASTDTALGRVGQHWTSLTNLGEWERSEHVGT